MPNTGDRLHVTVDVTRICNIHNQACPECEQQWSDMVTIETIGAGPVLRLCLCGLVFVEGKCAECYSEEFVDMEGDLRRDALRDRKATREEA